MSGVEPKKLTPRQQVLTEKDIEALSTLLKEHNHCTLGLKPEIATALNNLTAEELGMFKRGLDIMGNAANLIGRVILTAVVAGIIVVFTKGFWATIIAGVKQGVSK